MTHKTTFAVVFALVIFGMVFAQVPRIMNYQAKLTDAGGVAINDTCTIIFRIYDAATGGNLLWCDTMTVDVVNGLFDVQLDLSHNGGDTLKFNRPYWIALKVRDDPEMTPREKLAPVSFAFRSIYADTAYYTSGSGSSSCSDLLTFNGSITWYLIHGDRDDNNKYVCVSSQFSATSWPVARERCAAIGARLCTRHEYQDFYDDTEISSDGFWIYDLGCDGFNSLGVAQACVGSRCDSTGTEYCNSNHGYRCCVVRD